MKLNILWFFWIHLVFLSCARTFKIASNINYDDNYESELEHPNANNCPHAAIGRCDDNHKRDCENSDCDSDDEKEYQKEDKSKQLQLTAYQIANQAAKDAKSATLMQYGAGIAASQYVRKQLAAKAVQAAKAAEADLMSKKDVLQHIMKDLQRANDSFIEKRRMKERVERTHRLASLAYEKALSQLKAMRLAVQVADKNLEDAERARDGAESVFDGKKSSILVGKERVERLKMKLNKAKADLERAKQLIKETKNMAVSFTGGHESHGQDDGEPTGSDGVKCRRCSSLQKHLAKRK